MLSRRKLPSLNALRAFESAGRKLSFRAAADELGGLCLLRVAGGLSGQRRLHLFSVRRRGHRRPARHDHERRHRRRGSLLPLVFQPDAKGPRAALMG